MQHSRRSHGVCTQLNMDCKLFQFKDIDIWISLVYGHNMRPNQRKSQVYRVCAVCGKRHAATYGFRSTLIRYGIKGDKAAIECVRKLQQKEVGK
jgi:hypothetical protein